MKPDTYEKLRNRINRQARRIKRLLSRVIIQAEVIRQQDRKIERLMFTIQAQQLSGRRMP